MKALRVALVAVVLIGVSLLWFRHALTPPPDRAELEMDPAFAMFDPTNKLSDEQGRKLFDSYNRRMIRDIHKEMRTEGEKVKAKP